MHLGLKVVRAASAQTFGYFVPLMGATVVAALLSLPVIALGVVGGAVVHSRLLALLFSILLVVVLPNPASAGLQYLAAELANGEFIVLADQWTGLRRFARPALLIWGLSSAGTIIIVVNIAVYTHLGGMVGALRFIWWYILAFWIVMHLYVYPLLMIQDSLRPLAVYRNAYVLAAARPGAAVTLFLAWLLLLLVATVSGAIVVLGLALFAAIQQNALLTLRRSLEPSDGAR